MTSTSHESRTALSLSQSAWLLAAGGAACAPLVSHLPTWLDLTVGALLAWNAAILLKLTGSPPRWLHSTLALAGALGITLHYHTLFGRDPGVALLMLLLAMKLLEMRARRDAHAAMLLALFLVESQFLYSQSIANAGLALAGVTLACLALALLQPRLGSAAALRLSALMLAQAAPFLFFLFLLFPRVSGPLWGLPTDAYAGLSGLSESMSPGSISSLSLSEAIAFRAGFAGEQPAHSSLYWRGPVLVRFDGQAWTPGRAATHQTLPYATSGEPIAYSVTLEAHGKPWLFALELPGLLPADAEISADYQLLSRLPVRTRTRYEMRSYPDVAAGAQESPARLREALQLPAGSNPRARELAQHWRAETGADNAALVGRALVYFREQRFSYTLTPPLLGAQAMDEFLFDSRRGFCEHYAASFVFLMRAAGLPARVVTGYQGGEINPVDHTLIVRQSDAHAWAEVWLPERGWQRVDPTAAIAPTRIETNLAAALPEGAALPLFARFAWARVLRYRWDALANAWNQGVLGYTPQRQREVLSRLGLRAPDWVSMTWALGIACGALLAALAAWALIQRPRTDAALRAWRTVSSKLGRLGLARRPWEGPRDYARRVAAARPARSTDLARIAGLYAQLRYGGAESADALRELKSRVGRFKP